VEEKRLALEVERVDSQLSRVQDELGTRALELEGGVTALKGEVTALKSESQRFGEILEHKLRSLEATSKEELRRTLTELCAQGELGHLPDAQMTGLSGYGTGGSRPSSARRQLSRHVAEEVLCLPASSAVTQRPTSARRLITQTERVHQPKGDEELTLNNTGQNEELATLPAMAPSFQRPYSGQAQEDVSTGTFRVLTSRGAAQAGEGRRKGGGWAHSSTDHSGHPTGRHRMHVASS
jgi:hypothetical protein